MHLHENQINASGAKYLANALMINEVREESNVLWHEISQTLLYDRHSSSSMQERMGSGSMVPGSWPMH